jgi:hypothetical protein
MFSRTPTAENVGKRGGCASAAQESPLHYYRLYFLDAADRIRHAIDMECEDDATAIATAEPQADGRTMELWNRDRLVRRFARPPSTPEVKG